MHRAVKYVRITLPYLHWSSILKLPVMVNLCYTGTYILQCLLTQFYHAAV